MYNRYGVLVIGNGEKTYGYTGRNQGTVTRGFIALSLNVAIYVPKAAVLIVALHD